MWVGVVYEGKKDSERETHSQRAILPRLLIKSNSFAELNVQLENIPFSRLRITNEISNLNRFQNLCPLDGFQNQKITGRRK